MCSCMYYTAYYCILFFSVKSVLASIVMVSEREGTFRVQCTSTGGRPLSMTVTGPLGKKYNLIASIQSVGDPQGMGDDEFTASTGVLSGAMNGDVFQCRVSSGVPTMLKGVSCLLYSIHMYTCLHVLVFLIQILHQA